MLKKQIIYLAPSFQSTSGVYHKVLGILSSARKIGYQTEYVDYRCGFINTYSVVWSVMVKSQSKIIIMRSIVGIISLLLIPAYIIARLQKKYLVIDVPTPIVSIVNEIRFNSKANPFKKIIHIFFCYLSGPIPFWFFNKIVQYGNEGWFFSLGNKSRTQLIGNGIDSAQILLRKKDYLVNQSVLRLVAVANVSYYHGYDRVLKAIAKWNNSHEFKVSFTIIGDNTDDNVLSSLKTMSVDLGIDQYISFSGLRDSNYIYDAYSNCDLAVGSLGLFRIGLSLSSVLKIREYCLAGIPFIAAGDDPDFSISTPFRFVVSNDDNIESIEKVFEVFPQRRNLFSDEEIRQYALDHLSFDSKIKIFGI
jgi:glycosyltransferase involved in cell wall biosynthesis